MCIIRYHIISFQSDHLHPLSLFSRGAAHIHHVTRFGPTPKNVSLFPPRASEADEPLESLSGRVKSEWLDWLEL